MRVDTSTGWVSGIRHCPSPNYNQRPHGEVSLLVIHNISLPPGQFGTGKVQAFFGNQLARLCQHRMNLVVNRLGWLVGIDPLAEKPTGVVVRQ